MHLPKQNRLRADVGRPARFVMRGSARRYARAHVRRMRSTAPPAGGLKVGRDQVFQHRTSVNMRCTRTPAAPDT